MYFTSLFPYVVLFIFLIRGLTLEGAGVGITRMFKPKVSVLLFCSKMTAMALKFLKLEKNVMRHCDSACVSFSRSFCQR